MRHPILWTLASAVVLGVVGLGVRRALSDRHAKRTEADLLAVSGALPTFSEPDLAGLPEPAQRYLRHAIAPGTPLAPACRLRMSGSLAPTPGAPPVDLSAVETLAPRWGFVWTASATMKGVPVRVRDHYHRGEGGVDVVALGAVPVPLGGGSDVARSSRGRLVAEAVWCPTALVPPGVAWEAVDADRAQYSVSVDGETVRVTVRVDEQGALREVTMLRWGDVEGEPWRALPYGFRVEAEGTFIGVTIPTQLTGGWLYGTHRFDPASSASFVVSDLRLASP